jgi:hypothetical protein
MAKSCTISARHLEARSGHGYSAQVPEEPDIGLVYADTPAHMSTGGLDAFANQVVLACSLDQTCEESSVVTGAQ